MLLIVCIHEDDSSSPRPARFPTAPAQVPAVTPFPYSRGCFTWLPLSHASSLRQAHLSLRRRPRPSRLVADLYGAGEKAGPAYPQGMGRGGTAPGRGGSGVSRRRPRSIDGQRATAGAGTPTTPEAQEKGEMNVRRHVICSTM